MIELTNIIMIEEGYAQALDVLKKNITPMGFSASTEKHANYYSVWSRDHSVCSIAAFLSGDKELIDTAKKGLLLLLRSQADYGQVPSYIEVENRKKEYGGFGSITSVDSNLWVIIATASAYKRTKDKIFITDANMIRLKRIYSLLRSFDINNSGLIIVPKAGDWADIFNRTYHVLYDECLYYQALRDLKYLFGEGLQRTNNPDIRKKIKKRISWISKRQSQVKRLINELFWFTKENIPKIFERYMIIEKIEEQEYPYYQSHLMPFKHHWHKRFETFGNLLAAATGIANKKRTKQIINHVLQNKVNKPFPIKAMHPPVYKNEKGWEPIYRLKEQPHTYHNGGLWPLIGGFWIYLLVKAKMPKLAERELKNLSENLKKQNWKFNEYMNGQTGKPMGRTYQAWSAASYIIAYQAIKHNVNIFDRKS